MDESGGRSKRQKVDKQGRNSALERLRELKGSKRKYEVIEMENVYDTVDEREYTNRVLQRQEEDWIEDDDGCGYVEDGREIFDEEENVNDYKDRKAKNGDKDGKAKKRKSRVSALEDINVGSSKGNIRNMLSNMGGKKKEEVKVSEDDILQDIMSELKSDSSATTSTMNKKSTPNILKSSNYAQNSKKEAQDYFKNLSNSTNSNKPKTSVNPFSVNKKPESAPPLKVKVETVEKLEIFDVPSPKKDDTNMLGKIKVEKEDTPTQNIEEYNTQDLHFGDDIDFDDSESVELPIKKETIKDTIDVDGLDADDFTGEMFDKMDEDQNKAVKEEMKPDIKPTSDWADMGQTESMSYDCTSLPLATNKDGEKVMKFYWWDAWEDRFMKPGVVFLFGKVYIDPANPSSGCVSCCLTVRNVQRKLFLLPREYKLDPVSLEESGDPISIMDVYEEFNSKVASKFNIKEFKSRKVVKNYAFDLPNIPTQSDYLEVKYSATSPLPPTDKPYLTFSHIFGTNTSSLETFLLERKIKGPCWLEIRNPENVSNKISWCKLEANCLNPDDIMVVRDSNSSPPPLVVAALNTRMVMDPKTRQSKIVMMSCLINNAFEIHKPAPNPPFHQHFCVFTRSTNDIWPMDIKQAIANYKGTKLTKCDSERELLNYFLVQFWKLDPDLIVGHDMQGYQQDLLIGNILDKNIPNWSRLGRLKRTVVPLRKYAAKDAFLGRLVCDIKISAMELIKSRSFDLDTLCANVLKIPEGTRTEIISDDVFKYYETSRDILELVSLTMQDTSYILKMMCELNVLPLALQITQIAGNVMSRTLMGGRSERNEFLLLHAFSEKDYIVPDKAVHKKGAAAKEHKESEEHDEPDGENDTTTKRTQARKKPAYSGGLVLDPKKGFYDSLILLMDFNSLYPSIIQEYNICFTTIKRNLTGTSDEEINEMILPDSNAEQGILPTQIRRLVESRREVKKLMKTPDLTPEQYMQYNIRQLALKLTANSMYGCLGFTYSRFYAKPLAALVTMKGREILINTKELVQKLNYDVVYGDTDSIMINTNCLDYDQVFKIGQEIKKEINKKYRQVELDIDGVFRYLLLLKKKKYAAVLISKNKSGEYTLTQELKGLDIVRRDWSQLAAEAGKFILNQILSQQSADDRIESIQTHLGKLKDDLHENKMPFSMLTITKQLTKNPNEYADKNGQPHVQVALRLNEKNGRRFKKGDVVPYLICEDGTSNPAMQRAYHIEELKNNEHLKIDVNYYLAHQLHPVISRICDPIEGLDAARIADSLGLDPSGYKHSIKRETHDENDTYHIENEREKYNMCNDFTFVCINEKCLQVNKIREGFRKTDKDYVSFLEKCQNDQCNARPVDSLPTILNQLTKHIRNYNAKYYENWLICEDPACTNRTTRLPQCFAGGYPLCNLCEKGVMFREYTEKELYYQLSFFLYLFDVTKQNTQKVKLQPQIVSAFHSLKECVEDALSHSSYSVINLNRLFGFFDLRTLVNNVTIKSEPDIRQVDAPDYEMEDFNLHHIMESDAY